MKLCKKAKPFGIGSFRSDSTWYAANLSLAIFVAGDKLMGSVPERNTIDLSSLETRHTYPSPEGEVKTAPASAKSFE